MALDRMRDPQLVRVLGRRVAPAKLADRAIDALQFEFAERHCGSDLVCAQRSLLDGSCFAYPIASSAPLTAARQRQGRPRLQPTPLPCIPDRSMCR